MKTLKQDLGKVSVTCNGVWDAGRNYDRLCIVNDGNFASYISKKFTPEGILLSNEEYWQPIASLRDDIKIDYDKFKKEWIQMLAEIQLKLKASRIVVENDIERESLSWLQVSAGCEVYVKDTKLSWILESIVPVLNYKEWRLESDSKIDSVPTYELTGEFENLIADRTIADRWGHIIDEYYVTRDMVTNFIIETVRKYIHEVAILPGSIKPEDLSQAVLELIGYGQITNLADEEDLTDYTNANGTHVLRFKDKVYNEADGSGLGRVYLRKNKVQGVNTLVQQMIDKPNTIYIIQYDYSLNGQTIIIPANCTLKFAGGSFKNGTIQFNQTTFINPKFSNVRFTGSILNQQLNIDDFGAIKGDESFDNSVIINDLINLKKRDAYAGAKTIFVPSGAYYIKNSIQLYDYYNSNITLTGEGLSSVIAQVTDNIPIIKSYETTVISNLRLIYKNWQPATNTNATAIAVQRAIRSVFENLMIVDAQKGFGYITIADQESDQITTFQDQTYVNAVTRNVGIYQCSSYAIDLRKEIAQADSGSVYDNIYISSSHPINGYDETKPSVGAIYMGGSSMTFTQLNIESKYSDTLIMSTSLTNYLTIANLHIEGLTTMRTIYKQVAGQGFFDIGNIDIDRCAFTTNNLFLFYFSVSIKFNIDLITLRSSCTIPEGNQWFIFQQDSGTSYGRLGNHSYPAGMAPTRVNNSYDHIVLRIDRSDFLVTYGSQDQFTTPSINNWLLYAGGNTLAYLYNKAIYVDNNGDYRYPDGYLARLNGVTIRRSGTTDQRPALDTTFIGFTYYDTTINELLTWSGTGWINPDGTASSRVIYIKTVSDLNNLGTAGNYLLKIVGNVDLGGTNVTLPTGCVLDFQGGSFSNGTVTFNNTTIVANSSNYIFKNIIFKGSLKNSDFYVDWVGASTSNEDNSDFIKQAVIVSSTFRVPIVFNSVIYNITKPITLDTLINNVTIKGNKARIQKVNSITTDITEAVPTYGGDVNINYACIFCITEGHYWTIRDLAFYGGTTEAYNNYGIFIIKGSNFLIENVGFTYCSIAMYVFGLWMSNFTKITCTDVNVGFNFNSARLNDIIGNSGTSICFNNCYVNRCNTGFNLKWLNYSVLNSCAVDYATTNAYTYADKSCVTMNGCGSEASKSWINLLSNSNVVLNACQFLSTTAENTSTIVLFNSKILFNNCAFQDYITKAIFTNKESNITLIDTDVSITDITLVFNTSGVYHIKLENKVYIITYNGKRIENIIDYSNLLKGTTDNRPILASINEGFEYYDSTLKKKILWNGSSWTNLDGTALA